MALTQPPPLPQFAPPKCVGVEIEAVQPSAAENAVLTKAGRSLPPATYLVKLVFETLMEPTGHGWMVYVGDDRVSQYGEYAYGIYFTVIDPQFFQDHQADTVRFSLDGIDFADTGFKLEPVPQVAAQRGGRGSARLPSQEDVLRR